MAEHILHPEINFHWQNYLQSVSPGLGVNSSHFLHHSMGERNYNFHHNMPDYYHRYGPQCYGLSAVVHNGEFSIQDGYTGFPSHQQTWDHISHPQRNFNPSQQNSLYRGPSTIGHSNSQFPNHGISESNHNFYHHMTDNHNSNAPQSYGFHSEIPYHDPSIQNNGYTGFPSHQPRQYLVEHCPVIHDAENSWMYKFICECTGSSFSQGSHGHEGLLETSAMRRMSYPESEMNGFVVSHLRPSYTGNCQLHQDQQLPHMQHMRENNLNLEPQMPSFSSYGHQMDNPQQLYRSHSSWSSGTNSRNRYFRSSIPVDQMINQENLPSEYILDHDNLIIENEDDVIVLDAIDLRGMYPGFVDEGVLLSYEGQIVDLEEQMGHRSTGLSEEEIQRNLKIRNPISSADQFDLNETPSRKNPDFCLNQFDLNEALPSPDKEPEICVVCQVEYEDQEKIGTLECGHEYHAECIKKWLQEKNVCPICKSTALSIESE